MLQAGEHRGFAISIEEPGIVVVTLPVPIG